MGFLDRLLGRKKDEATEGTQTAPPAATQPTDDEPAAEAPKEHDHDHDPDHPHEH